MICHSKQPPASAASSLLVISIPKVKDALFNAILVTLPSEARQRSNFEQLIGNFLFTSKTLPWPLSNGIAISGYRAGRLRLRRFSDGARKKLSGSASATGDSFL